jgi:methylphosphotriester-DNA--protein-cysteine methyltransferase
MSLQDDQRHKGIVARVETFAIATGGDTVHIQDICERCGVTEHSLRKAFRLVYGLTPYRCLRTRRMRQAHEALVDAKPAENVTSIATQFGFLELGRFSVEYRAMFGERPSETLRRSRAIQRERRTSVPASVGQVLRSRPADPDLHY